MNRVARTKTLSKITVLYDDRCAFCRNCARWILKQPTYFAVEILPSSSAQALERYPTLKEKLCEELIVVDNHGGVYFSTDAWIIVLYALKAYRRWSLRLARPHLKPFARTLYFMVSRNRYSISRQLFSRSDTQVAKTLSQVRERGRAQMDVCELNRG